MKIKKYEEHIWSYDVDRPESFRDRSCWFGKKHGLDYESAIIIAKDLAPMEAQTAYIVKRYGIAFMFKKRKRAVVFIYYCKKAEEYKLYKEC